MLEIIVRIIGIIFPVFACTALGAYYGWRYRPDMSVVNKINMDVFTPLLVFWAITDKPFEWHGYTDLLLGGTAVILGSGLLLLPLVWLLRVELKTFLPPMMFNNSGNMGIPLILFAFGDNALQAAVILFMVEMILHFTVGFYMLDRHTKPWYLLRMPMILAALLGLLFSAYQISLPEPLANTIKLLGQVAIPLLLFSLGVRLLDVNFRDWKLGVLGAIVGPMAGLLSVLIVSPWLHLTELQWAQLLIFAALPPAVLNVLVAERFKQQPEQVASIVLIGNLGSVIIIPLVLWFVLP